MYASTIVKSLIAGVADTIAASQSLAAAGALTLSASPVVLDTGRQVIITSAGDDSALTWTVIGTNDSGSPIKDSFAGGNTTVAKSNLQNFKTVTSITGSGATASTVTAGTNGVGSSDAKIFSDTIPTPNIAFDCQKAGTVTFQVEYTQQPFLEPISPNGSGPAIAFGPNTPNPVWIPFTDLTNKSAAAQGAETIVFHAWRLSILSGTGAVTCTGRQSGLASP